MDQEKLHHDLKTSLFITTPGLILKTEFLLFIKLFKKSIEIPTLLQISQQPILLTTDYLSSHFKTPTLPTHHIPSQLSTWFLTFYHSISRTPPTLNPNILPISSINKEKLPLTHLLKVLCNLLKGIIYQVIDGLQNN